MEDVKLILAKMAKANGGSIMVNQNVRGGQKWEK